MWLSVIYHAYAHQSQNWLYLGSQEREKNQYLGLSECSVQTRRRAHKVHPVAVAEMEVFPFALEIESPETNRLETVRDLGVKIVAYSPLGSSLAGSRLEPISIQWTDVSCSHGSLRRILQIISSLLKHWGPSRRRKAALLASWLCRGYWCRAMVRRIDPFLKGYELTLKVFIPQPGTEHVKH